MKKSVFIAHSLEELNKLELSIHKRFIGEYKRFFEEYEHCGISLLLQPCYWYRGKFHTKKNNRYCYLTYRVILLPKGYVPSQAQKRYVYKKFFSKKIAVISKDSQGYRVKSNGIKDCFFKYYINKFLVKAKARSLRGEECIYVLNENFMDVLWSAIFFHRYRNEVKRTLRGKRLEWLFLVFVFALICLSCYVHLRFLEQFG